MQNNSRLRQLLLIMVIYVVLVYSVTAIFPAPRAVSLRFLPKSAQNVTFLADLSWIDASGTRHLEQQIFDTALGMIDEASSFIVLDMFLFNDWQGPVSEPHRALSQELTDNLIRKKQAQASLSVTVISDPVNTVYGGVPSKHFTAMRAAGIDVVLSDLTRLQDSNPLYSGIWRWLIRPFGNSTGSALPNPFGPGKVSVRSYLTLLNFKANHRKLLVADNASGELQALVTSANPHDGSSAHRNVGVTFSGEAVLDLLVSEKALLNMSNAEASWQTWPASVLKQVEQAESAISDDNVSDDNVRKDADLLESVQATVPIDGSAALTDTQTDALQVQVVSESRIKQAVLHILGAAQANDRVDLLMFYLSDRDIVNALKTAHERGAQLRVLLDVNQDAFGRKKNGVPNRPVAAELVEQGIAVRWCATAGEQCHAKMLYRAHANGAELLLGSGNYTRRNLDDFNLETDVWLRAAAEQAPIEDAAAYFETQWSNQGDKTYSTDYQQYADESGWLKWQYRIMEATGFSTF